MTRTLEQRKQLAALLPWVTRRKEPTPRCDGIKWGRMALKDLPAYHRNEVPIKARCSHKGWFTLRPLPPRKGHDTARKGTYCFEHLTRELFDHERERKRALRWWRGHPELLEDLGGSI